MKVKNSIKKVGAVAGSALMVGLTMGSAASLADFPQPFVDDDGTVASQIVVGSNGKVADVVGAVNIAAAAGQSAVQTEERTAGGSTSAGWNANNGQTLSTENTNLFFQDNFDKSGLKTTMTKDDLDILSSGTVANVDGSDYDYDQYIEVGSHATSVGNGGELDDDTLLVDFGETPDGSQLYTARTTFAQSLNLTDAADDNAEIELFGKQFSVSSDSDLSESGGDKIVLFGGQETATVSEDSSTSVTIGGQTIDLYVDSVTGPGNANVEIDGSLKSDVSPDNTFSVPGIDEEVRIDKIVYRGSLDYGQRGRVVFSIGSEKLTLQHDQPVQVQHNERLANELDQIDEQLEERDTIHTEIVDELKWKIEQYTDRLEHLYNTGTGKQDGMREQVKDRIISFQQQLREEHRDHWGDRQELERERRTILRELSETEESLSELLE